VLEFNQFKHKNPKVMKRISSAPKAVSATKAVALCHVFINSYLLRLVSWGLKLFHYKACILVLVCILLPGCNGNYATSAGRTASGYAASSASVNNKVANDIFQLLHSGADNDMEGAGMEKQQPGGGTVELNKMKPVKTHSDGSEDVWETGIQDGGDEENKPAISFTALMRMIIILLFIVLII